MYLTLLGRQSEISIAELERYFGPQSIKDFSDSAAILDIDNFNLEVLGSIPKAGRVVEVINSVVWQNIVKVLIDKYTKQWQNIDYKITLGISVYGSDIKARDVQKVGLIIKSKLKKSGISLRLIPNVESNLNTATSHHNKLGLSENKIELLVVKIGNKTYIAESIGAQNITAYARRDQERPCRDAFVGMLPPKLAQIMINLACGQTECHTILDPFCGTGVILQEAALMNHSVYGTDLSEKMIRYSRDNLNWLATKQNIKLDWYLHQGDATNARWRQPINAVVAETYLGQPFSAPPSPAKLEEVKQNCNHIISEFLKNIGPQLEPDTPICIAVPAWRDKQNNFTHLPFIDTVARLGYKPYEFHHVRGKNLLYYRDNQIVAREILILNKL